jgi:ATP-binding cassette, subfamily B, multidrug efflux pump
MRRILALYRPYRWLLLLGLVAILFSSGFALTIPWILKVAIDRLTERQADTTLLPFAAALVVFTLLQGTFRFVARRTIVGVSRQIEYDLRNQFYRQWLRLDRNFYDRVPSGDLMARATQDMSNLRMLLGAGPLHFSSTIIMAIFAVVLMARLDPWLTVYAWPLSPCSSSALKNSSSTWNHNSTGPRPGTKSSVVRCKKRSPACASSKPTPWEKRWWRPSATRAKSI